MSRSVVLWNCLPPDVPGSGRPKQGSNGDAFSSSLGSGCSCWRQTCWGECSCPRRLLKSTLARSGAGRARVGAWLLIRAHRWLLAR